MKRISGKTLKKGALLCAMLLAASGILTACGSSSSSTASTTAAATTAAAETTAAAAETEAPAETEAAAEAEAASTWEPTQPITIMNYVAAGGGMDVATRKFAEIAAKYTDATIVVDNTPGAGGMTAIEYVLSQEADGYTVFAGTVSNIAYLVANEEDLDYYVWGLDWIDDIMADPYCIMVSSDSEISSVEDLLAACEGGSVWCGPSTGGAKHLAALQFWNALGIEDATWVPFESGPEALLAVIGGQGIASVGNPGDVEGRDLKSIVIATEDKLANYPDVANFADSGYAALDELNMWRGFAVKDGTPEEMIVWFQNLVDQVTADEEWQQFFSEKSIVVFNKKTDEFEQIIKDNIADYIDILKGLELIDAGYEG
ncbi:MAG: tripartite tricarboxylate transporter substrate binding protein [Clostridiales bacterium]|nr:tripartite tricarboxylate transporter substrate binding protein [Clostridiales bacterium]